MRMRKKTKGLPNYIQKISPYCKKNLFLTICALISQKPVQKRGTRWKMRFFRYLSAGRRQSGAADPSTSSIPPRQGLAYRLITSIEIGA